jgi:hypothetical protein
MNDGSPLSFARLVFTCHCLSLIFLCFQVLALRGELIKLHALVKDVYQCEFHKYYLVCFFVSVLLNFLIYLFFRSSIVSDHLKRSSHHIDEAFHCETPNDAQRCEIFRIFYSFMDELQKQVSLL